MAKKTSALAKIGFKAITHLYSTKFTEKKRKKKKQRAKEMKKRKTTKPQVRVKTNPKRNPSNLANLKMTRALSTCTSLREVAGKSSVK